MKRNDHDILVWSEANLDIIVKSGFCSDGVSSSPVINIHFAVLEGMYEYFHVLSILLLLCCTLRSFLESFR